MIFLQKNKIFSKTLKSDQSKIFNPKFFSSLDNFSGEKDAIFLFDEYDASLRNVTFDKMMEDYHWNFYINEKTSKIFINFSSDYINFRDLESIYKTIIFRNLDTSRIYILVMDENYVRFVKNYFAKHNISNIKVACYNILLKKTPFYKVQKNKVEARFSAFSRNFNNWRLRLFIELQNENLLSKFKYSFGTRNPYSGEEFDKNKIINLLPNCGFNKNISPLLDEWISNSPYLLDSGKDKFALIVSETIANCGIHLLIESHFDTFATDHHALVERLKVEEYSPAFPTEKTWKALSCCVPIIAFTTPYFLRDLRKLGFKTYSPFIDESYDLIEDNEARFNAIFSEIKRLSSLSEGRFNALLKNTKPIAEYNKMHLLNIKKNIQFNNDFIFMEEIKAKYIEYSNVRL